MSVSFNSFLLIKVQVYKARLTPPNFSSTIFYPKTKKNAKTASNRQIRIKTWLLTIKRNSPECPSSVIVCHRTSKRGHSSVEQHDRPRVVLVASKAMSNMAAALLLWEFVGWKPRPSTHPAIPLPIIATCFNHYTLINGTIAIVGVPL